MQTLSGRGGQASGSVEISNREITEQLTKCEGGCDYGRRQQLLVCYNVGGLDESERRRLANESRKHLCGKLSNDYHFLHQLCEEKLLYLGEALGEAVKNAFRFSKPDAQGRDFVSIAASICPNFVALTISNSTDLRDHKMFSRKPKPTILANTNIGGYGTGMIDDFVEKELHGLVDRRLDLRDKRIDVKLILNLNEQRLLGA